jgi:hypothetical protein
MRVTKEKGVALLLFSGLAMLVGVLILPFVERKAGLSLTTFTPRSEMPTPELLVDAPGTALATLVSFERSVKSKRADRLAWEQAREDMSLYGNDSVRTFDRSWAEVLFGHGDVIEVDENTLIIITARKSQNENEISMALLSPTLLKNIANQPAEERERMLQEAMTSREVRVVKIAGGGPDGEGVRVGVKTLTDETNSLVSHSGTVKLIGPDGAEIVLEENMATTLGAGGKLATPRPVLPAPALSAPRDGTVYAFQRKAPRVNLAWDAVNGAGAYRIVMARDPEFDNIFVDELLEATSLVARNLDPGRYYWRVRAQDPEGIESAFSTTHTIRATRDDTPPQLSIAFPPEMYVASGPEIEVRGMTDRGARVRVNGHAVAVDPDGRFTSTLDLAEGAMLITVEAIDSANNVEYGKRLITYRGKRSQIATNSERP